MTDRDVTHQSGIIAAIERCWRLSIIAMAFALTGCASDFHIDGRFEFGVPLSATGKPFIWPTGDAETPRYMLVGQLLGEQNYRKPERTGLQKVAAWVIGLFDDSESVLELWRPVAGAVDREGRIYVTDMARKGVMVFDRKQGFLEFWAGSSEFESYLSPTGIATTADGFVLIADSELQRVFRVDRTGKSAGVIGAGILVRPNGVAVDDATGRIFVVDTHAHDVKVFDHSGNLLATWGRHGEDNGGLNYPTYAAYANGRLYVTDTMNARVQILDGRDGTPLRSIGSRGLHVGQFVRPKGIAVDNDENLYVVESMYDHLLIYNRAGEFLLPIGGTGDAAGNFYLPSGVWTDPDNRVYVADMFNGRVMVFQYLGGDGHD